MTERLGVHPAAENMTASLITAGLMGIWLNESVLESFATHNNPLKAKEVIQRKLPNKNSDIGKMLVDLLCNITVDAERAKTAVDLVKTHKSKLLNDMKKTFPKYVHEPANEEESLGGALFYLLTKLPPSGPIRLNRTAIIEIESNHFDTQVLRHPQDYEYVNSEMRYKKKKHSVACGGFFHENAVINDPKTKQKVSFPLIVQQSQYIHYDPEAHDHEWGHFFSKHTFNAIDKLTNTDRNIAFSKSRNRFKKIVSKSRNTQKSRSQLKIEANKLLPEMFESVKSEFFSNLYAARSIKHNSDYILQKSTKKVEALYDYWEDFVNTFPVHQKKLVKDAISDAKRAYYKRITETIDVTEYVYRSLRELSNIDHTTQEKHALFWAVFTHYPVDRLKKAMKVFFPKEYKSYCTTLSSVNDFHTYKRDIKKKLRIYQKLKENSYGINLVWIGDKTLNSILNEINSHLSLLEDIAKTSMVNSKSVNMLAHWESVNQVSRDFISKSIRSIELSRGVNPTV